MRGKSLILNGVSEGQAALQRRVKGIRTRFSASYADPSNQCYTAMTNGHGIETPTNKIAAAQATLGLAIRLYGEVEAGRITTEIFKRGVTVHTGGDGLRVCPVTSYGITKSSEHEAD